MLAPLFVEQDLGKRQRYLTQIKCFKHCYIVVFFCFFYKYLFNDPVPSSVNKHIWSVATAYQAYTACLLNILCISFISFSDEIYTIKGWATIHLIFSKVIILIFINFICYRFVSKIHLFAISKFMIKHIKGIFVCFPSPKNI